MTPKQLYSEVSNRTGLDTEDIAKIHDAMFEVIKDTVHDGNVVRIRGFGDFMLKKNRKKTPVWKPTKFLIDDVREKYKVTDAQ